jgi:hypothetical protein
MLGSECHNTTDRLHRSKRYISSLNPPPHTSEVATKSHYRGCLSIKCQLHLVILPLFLTNHTISYSSHSLIVALIPLLSPTVAFLSSSRPSSDSADRHNSIQSHPHQYLPCYNPVSPAPTSSTPTNRTPSQVHGIRISSSCKPQASLAINLRRSSLK